MREYLENCTAEPKETIKAKLENMDAILREIENQACMIEDAINGPKVKENKAMDNQLEPMGIMIDRMMGKAEEILKTVIIIREALW